MSQFIPVRKDIASNQELSMAEVMAYSFLDDRMKSSVTRNDFYDKDFTKHYVIYTVEEMAEAIHTSQRTVNKIFSHLKELGLIITKQQLRGAAKIFLPKFKAVTKLHEGNHHMNADSSFTRTHNLRTNHNTSNQHVGNTVNTGTVDYKSAKQNKLKSWINSTHSVVGLTLSTLIAIKNFSKGKIKDCKKLVRIILNARNSVAVKAKIAKTAVTQFESNKNLQDDLADKLDHIFTYVKSRGMTSYYGYITNALKDYFKIAFGLAKPLKIVKPDKQRVRFDNGKPKIKETIPDYMTDNDYHKASKAERARVQQMLKDLDAEK